MRVNVVKLQNQGVETSSKSIEALVQDERRAGTDDEDASVAVAVLWNGRILRLCERLIRDVVKSDAPMPQLAHRAYKTTLEPHHNWIMRSGARALLRLTPDRRTLFETRLGYEADGPALRADLEAFAAGHAIALESDGAGALSIRVTNPGGLVHSQQLTKGPASVFLQQNDFNLGFSLCDLSNKYKQAIYGVEDDELEGWMPTEHSPYFAFETKYTKASKRLMTAKTSLTLATAGCALDGKAFEASSFVDALEAVEAQC